jgi:indole-3-glycerol phosphate synthase
MILDEIVESKRQDMAMEELAMPFPLLARKAEAAPPPRDFRAALAAPGLSVIAEVKRASPSAGVIAADFDPVGIACQYERGGAAAVSVLTERRWFMGSNRYLTRVRDEVALPVLRKDFIVCERQVVGARAIGADAVLLIAAILDDETLKRLHELAAGYGMAVLVEAHTQDEVKRAADAGAAIIGVNNRDLSTMKVSLSMFERLRKAIPAGTLAVAESGIREPADARRMRDAGADAVLVGETLMRAGNIPDALRSLRRGA